ncbi:hypothetical protein AAKU55_000567 [Oxalobacteraceae bacterium GrIS 1.11]
MMNASTSHPDNYAPARQRRIVLGIAVSLALHGLLMYGYRFGATPKLAPDDARTVESMTVWLRPPARPKPPPVVVVAARVAPKTGAVSSVARRAAPAMTPAWPARPALELSAIPAAPGQAAPAEAPPRFDMDAARRTARAVAGERDPARAGTAVGQIPDAPLQTETQLARDIAQGKRGSCKDAPGGLLAPLLLLLDKKDSGCKW